MDLSGVAAERGRLAPPPLLLGLRLRERAWPRTDAGVLCALAALTLGGAVLRFTALGAQSFWGDEAQTVTEMRSGFGGMLGSVLGNETTPPLYFVLAWMWAQLFGSGEVGLRSLSALAGTAMVPLSYAAASLLFSRRAGLIAAALAAVNPFLIWYSQEARAYALFMALAALSFIFFVLALRREERRWTALWALASGLALATHFFAVFVVVPEALWFLLALRNRRAFACVGAVAAVGLALLPLALVDQGHGTAWIAGTPLDQRIGRSAGEFVAGRLARWSQFGYALVAFAGAAAAGLVAAVLAMRGDRRRSASIALAIGGLAVAVPLALAVLGADYVIPRNLSAAWLPLAVVVAGALASRRAAVIGSATAAALCALSLAATVEIGTRPELQRPDWRAVAAGVGPTTSTRAIVADASGAEPLGLYLAGVAHPAPTLPIAVHEIVVVRHASSTRRAHVAGFELTRRSLPRATTITTKQLRARAARTLDPRHPSQILVLVQRGRP